VTIDELGAEPGLLVVDVDPVQIPDVRAALPVLANRRL
jgi:deaminated glutathione amidase